MSGIKNRLGKIGVYGEKTRSLQRRLSFEAFGLSWKTAKFFLYLGDRSKETPNITDIGTHVFFEVPDRAYAEEYVEVPIGMEPIPENKTDFSRFGLVDPLSNETTFRMHIDDTSALGRRPVVGDVFEIPFFEREGRKAFWEISDVDDSQEVEKYILIIHASPLNKKRTTREIPINNTNDALLDDFMQGMDSEFSDIVPVAVATEDPTPEKQPVDFRREVQASFLDDINKEF